MRPLNPLTYVYLALLPQHWALSAKVDSTPTFVYLCIFHVHDKGAYKCCLLAIYIVWKEMKNKSIPSAVLEH